MEDKIVSSDNSFVLHELMKDPSANGNEIKKVLMRKPNVNFQIIGQTALMVGATRIGPDGYSELVDGEIIQDIMNQTDFTLTDTIGNTILHYFCLFGVQKKIETLIDKCDFLAQNSKNEVALHHVHNIDIMNILLEKYKNIETWPTFEKSELLTNTEDYFKNLKSNVFKKPVIELFCQSPFNYPVPFDIAKIIMFSIKESTDESLENLEVLQCLLRFGSDYIDADLIKAAIKKGSKTIFDATISSCKSSNLQNIVCTTDVLLECLKNKKCGDMFFKDLLRHLNDMTILTQIHDCYGAYLAHYICKFENLDLLEDLSKNESVFSQLFRLSDGKGCYPVAYLNEKTNAKFIEALYMLYSSYKNRYETISLAKPSVNLIHYAIDTKKSKLATNLLSAGFPLTNNSDGQNLLHKIVLSSFKKATLLQMILEQVSYFKILNVTKKPLT